MTEYVNKDYYNSIKGNCTYIDLNANTIHKVMERLRAEGIMFSATYGGYRNTITVSKSDAQREPMPLPPNTRPLHRISRTISSVSSAISSIHR